MTSKPIKPRRMWAEKTFTRPLEKTSLLRFSNGGWHDHNIPVLVIDLSPESVERAAAEAAKAMYADERLHKQGFLTWDTTLELVRTRYIKDAKAALAAIGIKPVKKGDRK